MKNAEPGWFVVERFTAAFRRQVHLLLAWGIDAAQTKVKPDSEEEEITGFIAAAIQHCLIRQPVSWTKFYAVRNEHPIPSDEHPGKKRNDIDLIIEFVAGVGRPEFVFEAKQLNYAKGHQRERNYIDAKGMERFLSGDYADYTARYPEVGMLGYVLSDSAATWSERLKAAIVAKTAELALRRPQESIRIVDAFPLEWTSEHDRSSANRPITIYHILIPCIETSGNSSTCP